VSDNSWETLALYRKRPGPQLPMAPRRADCRVAFDTAVLKGAAVWQDTCYMTIYIRIVIRHRGNVLRPNELALYGPCKKATSQLPAES